MGNFTFMPTSLTSGMRGMAEPMLEFAAPPYGGGALGGATPPYVHSIVLLRLVLALVGVRAMPLIFCLAFLLLFWCSLMYTI